MGEKWTRKNNINFFGASVNNIANLHKQKKRGTQKKREKTENEKNRKKMGERAKKVNSGRSKHN